MKFGSVSRSIPEQILTNITLILLLNPHNCPCIFRGEIGRIYGKKWYLRWMGGGGGSEKIEVGRVKVHRQ